MPEVPSSVLPSHLATIPVWITPRETAQILGLSRNEVYELLNEGVIESRHHGRRRLVLLASVQMFAFKLPA